MDLKNTIKTTAYAAALAAVLIIVTACNKNKGNGAQAAESAVQAKEEVAAVVETAATVQNTAPAASAQRLNGSWLTSIPNSDGYYKLNNGSYEYYNSRSGDLIIHKGTYTINGDIITFTQTHYYGGPFSLHNNVLYTKDEVKSRYETPVELTDELFDEYFPDTFISHVAKYIPDTNQDYDIWISQYGTTYKRILASGQIPAAAAAPRSLASADFKTNGTVLEKYNGNEKFVIIPEGIAEIGVQAFIDNKNITNVVIPAGVKTINAGAFLNCTGLTSVNIPYGVTVINSGAFNGCVVLTGVTIPESVTMIDEFAFQKCTGIKSLTIPKSVNHIGNYTFSGWTSSQTIIILGKDNEAAADAAWDQAQNGEYFWRGNCKAKIVYL